jgi:hypothetical protein
MPCWHSREEDHGRGQVKEGEEVAGSLVVTSGDPSAMFESREQSLDLISFAIQMSIVETLNFAVLPGWVTAWPP